MTPTKCYVDEEGNYLTVVAGRGYYRIAWFVKELDESGAYVGDLSPSTLIEKDVWERKTIDAAVEPFSCGWSPEGFAFDSMAQARKALAAANTALLRRDATPCPEWAVIATSNGWKPPKGWKT